MNKAAKFWIGVACKEHVENSVKLYQKFTAIGEVIDDAPYQVDMRDGFKPFRHNINYFEAKHIDIKPLVGLLPFIKNKNSWGYVFLYGLLEIDQESFEIIAGGILEFNPLLEEVLDHANKA